MWYKNEPFDFNICGCFWFQQVFLMDFLFVFCLFFVKITLFRKLKMRSFFVHSKKQSKTRKNIETGKVLGSERNRVSKGRMCIHNRNNQCLKYHYDSPLLLSSLQHLRLNFTRTQIPSVNCTCPSTEQLAFLKSFH